MLKKKTVALLIVSLLIGALALAGCGPKESGGETQQSKKLELSFATGGTAGTYFPLGGAIANVWSENIEGVQVTVQPSGASVENIRLLASGEADIVMAMNNIAEDAWLGKGSFDKPIKNFRAVGVVYPEIIQGVALKESGIKTVRDLKGKRVAPGPVGSGTAATTPHIFEAYGLSLNDMEVHYDTFGDAVNKMKDGQLDAAWNVIAAPGAAIVDLLTAREIVFMEITGDELKKLQEKFPLVAPHVIPAGTYSYKGKPYPDIHTIALQAVLYVREDLDEDLVYQLAKIMYEKTEDIGHARKDQIKLENALNGVTTDFHPGAIKYYKEKGMM
ncbi:MAG: uncharacterized protein PWP66_194 [Thermosediminibacterales bacterium]|jgi:hypothetical protein|nr:uncharacterized protein [Thermosediminibacterales bacterium]MDK2901264.1 uncharacterized protein [Thermosediminibacterales bacterium]NPV42884.1 TAXI family TRAP transporter solute-binding subunit [Bacillota bacterium]